MAEDTFPPKDFADSLVDDPANPPRLQALTGYRGRSAKEGHSRLYLDPELSAWVDIPDDAILLTRGVHDDYGLGKSVVWAKHDAQLEHGPQAAAGGGTGADFLQGQMAQELGGAAGFAPRQPLPTQLNCPTHAPYLCLQTPPRLCPPHTSNPAQCPSLGIACTFLPPCPQHTANPAVCPSVIDACPTRLCHTQVVQQCLPHLTSSPQFCPVATPNPGCFPGGTIGNPGGPIEGGQVAEAFRNMAPPAITFPPCQVGVTHGCPPPNTHWTYTAPPSLGCPPPTSACPTHPFWCRHVAVNPNREFAPAFQAQAVTPAPQCLQPVHPTLFCPVFTHNFHQCIPQTLACPVSPWCPWTFPVTGPGPGTTPQFGQAGGQAFAGAQAFDAQAQGGMAAAGVMPQLQFQSTNHLCPPPLSQHMICPRTVLCYTSPQFCRLNNPPWNLE
jgi:hypothetical protein